MTYNIRLDLPSDGENSWQNRKQFFASQILFYQPDILGVQEAMPSQINDLDSALVGYAHIGIGREGVGKGEASAIFYTKTKYSVSHVNTFWLSETPNVVSKGWDASYLRVCTYGLFKDKRTGKQFWVFNTHLDNNGELARVNGAALIMQKIKRLNKNNLPVFFMGDFNALPESAVITNVKTDFQDAKDVSIMKPFGPSGTFNGFEHNKPVTTRIDYIFLTNNKKIVVDKYAVLSDAIDCRYPSDHLPVYVEINYN